MEKIDFQGTKLWRKRWSRGDFPTRYDPVRQLHVNAELHRMWLKREKVPGGATSVWLDGIMTPIRRRPV